MDALSNEEKKLYLMMKEYFLIYISYDKIRVNQSKTQYIIIPSILRTKKISLDFYKNPTFQNLNFIVANNLENFTLHYRQIHEIFALQCWFFKSIL